MTHDIAQDSINKLNDFAEPVFYFGLKKSRKIPAYIDAGRLQRCFEFTLKQNQKDLSCHLQRIQFAVSENNKEEVFAALCDLFIVLGPLGLPLRQRLFAYCKNRLDQQQAEILASYLAENYLTDELDFLPDSCFFKKIPVHLFGLDDRSMRDLPEPEDVLLIAESYIENSQFDTAVEYMLTQLEQHPENEELTVKLLRLYKALDYTNEFLSAYDKFSKHSATSRHWDDMKQYFLNQ